MIHLPGKCLYASALSLAVVVTGCDSDRPVAGITNPNAGSMADPDKAAVRTDLPVPDANPGARDPIAEVARPIPAAPATGENRDKDVGKVQPTGPGKEPSPEGPR
jgi:hypothetical protein